MDKPSLLFYFLIVIVCLVLINDFKNSDEEYERIFVYGVEDQKVNKMLREAYKRYAYEVKVSHILFSLPSGASAGAIREKYNLALNVRRKFLQGEPFNVLAVQYSDDYLTKFEGGSLPFFKGNQVQFDLENAAYTTAIGAISAPVRTSRGIHLVKVDTLRKISNSISASQILIKANGARAAELHKTLSRKRRLKKFAQYVSQFSEDSLTKSQGGLLPLVNAYSVNVPLPVKKAILGFNKQNELAALVRSSQGWHIIKCNKIYRILSYEEFAARNNWKLRYYAWKERQKYAIKKIFEINM